MSERKPMFRRLPGGGVEVAQVDASGGQDVRTTLVINAALKYAALRGRPETPRNPNGQLGGKALGAWFTDLVAFAESDVSEHAERFLAEIETIDDTPESA